MNYGLYLSATGALSSMHRQDVLANNLANMHTVGFKPDAVETRERLPERIEDPGQFAEPKWLLERLGGGQFVEATRVVLQQGGLSPSSNELDLALEGDGLFVVSDGRGTGPDNRMYTRSGRFTLNDRRELVTATGGHQVLSDRNRPIRLDPSRPVHIGKDGAIAQDGRAVGQIGIVGVADGRDLRKVGDNLLRFVDGASGSPRPDDVHVQQGFLENSAVDPITTLNDLMSAAKAAMANLKMMQYHDQLLGQTFNTFGRVA